MMSDLSGFTAMGEQFDPEIVHEVMGRIKDLSTTIVERFGGTVNQFIGDEIVALFGLPNAAADDARRAVDAAHEIHGQVSDLSREYEARLGLTLTMHTGVHTGLLVAEISDQRNGTYSLTGNTINTAARILNLAGRGELVVGEPTMEAIKPFFDLEFAGAHQVRNKAEPVRTFRVLRPLTGVSRFDVAQQRGLTQLTGRRKEIEQLLSLLDAARAGAGQAVLIEGPTGAGKSRLGYEFVRRALADRPAVNLWKGRCQAFGTATPYLPFIEILRHQAGIEGDDGPDDVAAKVQSFLSSIDPELTELEPVYLYLLSVTAAADLPTEWQGAPLAEVLQESLIKLIAAAASGSTLILHLEDWHWADAASRAVEERLRRALTASPLLTVITTRPTDRLVTDPRNVLILDALTHEETTEMIAAMTTSQTVEPTLAVAIHERTLGNPFFIEELMISVEAAGSTVRRDGRLELVDPGQALRMPETVQATVLGRIDSLPHDQSRVLRTASVIGREFDSTLLGSLLPGLDVDDVLTELFDQRFVEPMEASATRYRFHHVTTQEVAYDTLLLKQRRHLHAEIAGLIEASQATTGPVADRNVEELAHHFRLADDHDRAIHYLTLAGTKATERRALAAARDHLGAALEQTKRLSSTPEVRAIRGDVALKWARSCIFRPLSSQVAALKEVREEAAQDGNHRVALLAGYWISWLGYSLGNQHAAETDARELIATLEAVGDTQMLGMVQTHLAQVLGIQRRNTEAHELFEIGIQHRDEVLRPGGEWDFDTIDGPYCYAFTQEAVRQGDIGRVSAANELLAIATHLTTEIKDHATRAAVLTCDAIVAVYDDDWQRVLRADASIRELPEASVSSFVHKSILGLRGYAVGRLGELQTGIEALLRCVTHAPDDEAQLSTGRHLSLLSDLLLRDDRAAEARETAERALERRDVGDNSGTDLAERVLLILETDAKSIEARVAQLRLDAEAAASPRSEALAELAAAEAWLRHDRPGASAEHHRAAVELCEAHGLTAVQQQADEVAERLKRSATRGNA